MYPLCNLADRRSLNATRRRQLAIVILEPLLVFSSYEVLEALINTDIQWLELHHSSRDDNEVSVGFSELILDFIGEVPFERIQHEHCGSVEEHAWTFFPHNTEPLLHHGAVHPPFVVAPYAHPRWENFVLGERFLLCTRWTSVF